MFDPTGHNARFDLSFNAQKVFNDFAVLATCSAQT